MVGKDEMILHKKIILLLFVLLFVVSFSFLSFYHPVLEEMNDSTADMTIVQNVLPDEAESIYMNFTNQCNGTYIWNISEGEEKNIMDLNMIESCSSENYYSKLFGYTYDEEQNLIFHVKVLKKVNNQLFQLNHTLVGDYLEGNINDLLDQGTSYEYVFQKEGNQYRFIQLRYL